MSQKFILNPSAATDLILKPAVGVTCVTSSDANCFSSVVLPELSKPKSSILTSFSGVARNFLKSDNKPCNLTQQIYYYILSFISLSVFHSKRMHTKNTLLLSMYLVAIGLCYPFTFNNELVNVIVIMLSVFTISINKQFKLL